MHASTLFAALGLCAVSLVNAIPVSHPFSHNAFAKRAGANKAVFAHFMMGNAFPYTQKDFEDDVKLASASGIDAFALNIGTDSWQPDHVKMAYVCFNRTVLRCFLSNFNSFLATMLPPLLAQVSKCSYHLT